MKSLLKADTGDAEGLAAKVLEEMAREPVIYPDVETFHAYFRCCALTPFQRAEDGSLPPPSTVPDFLREMARIGLPVTGETLGLASLAW